MRDLGSCGSKRRDEELSAEKSPPPGVQIRLFRGELEKELVSLSSQFSVRRDGQRAHRVRYSTSLYNTRLPAHSWSDTNAVRKKTSPEKRTATATAEDCHRPEVIVDFTFDCGVFHIVVENIGTAPAQRVSVKFNRKFHGLGGRQEMSSLRLFRCIEFLAPHKKIETLLDTSDAYFQRREPTHLIAVVSFRDTRRRSYERRIVHDLSIYKSVSYLVKTSEMHSSAVPQCTSAAGTRRTDIVNYGHTQRPSLH